VTPERFEYFAPRSLHEALALLERYGEDARLLAGGQSLLAAMKLRLAAPAVLVDLNRIHGLSGIRDDGDADADAIAIGAMTRYSDVLESDTVAAHCGLLKQTVAVIADVQIRNRGTVGGALAHADPAGDLPAAMLALDAQLKAVSLRGERWINARDFFVTTYTTALQHDEVLVEIRVPRLDGRRSTYLKAARRPSDFAMVGVAAVGSAASDGTCERIAVAITGVADRAYRASQVERALVGSRLDHQRLQTVVASVTDGIEVADDVHASSAYRAHLTRVYVERAVSAVLSN
jgi:aerobic carbon-monoxide dehydrogenase medium subunit